MNWIGALNNREVIGVVHVGANAGEEYPEYMKRGISKQLWIEPQPGPFMKLLERLWENPDAMAFKIACGSKEGTGTVYVTDGNEGHSSSLLFPKLHLRYHPELPVTAIVETRIVTLDSVFDRWKLNVNDYDLLVLDVQGYELEVLKGASEVLKNVKYVISEVNREELYTGCAMIEDIDEHLKTFGFKREWEMWCGPNESYGDAFYVR